jgi:L-ribulokinase
MDGRLSGGFLGLTLGTRPEQLYRALMEATGFGLRWIVETVRDAGVPVRQFVASGGLPARNPLLMQIYADILGQPIAEAESQESVALGAAILGCLAAGSERSGHATAQAAIGAMARQRTDRVHQPNAANGARYDELYRMYRELAAGTGVVATLMRRLQRFSSH